MSDFLYRLAARTLGAAPVAEPLVPAMFAPGREAARAERASEWPAHEQAVGREATSGPPIPDRTGTTLPERASQAGRGPASPSPALSRPTPPRLDTVQTETTEGDWPNAMLDAGSTRATSIAARSDDSLGATVVAPILWRAEKNAEPTSLPSAAPASRPVDPNPTASEWRDEAAAPQGISASGPRPPSAWPAAAASPARSLPASAARQFERIAADAQPGVIRVTIGRIDVRAQLPAAVPHDAGARKPRSTARSLDEYLKERLEGKR